jgi:hypothetical protein
MIITINSHTHVESCLDENKLGHDQKHDSSAVRHASSCLPRLPANASASQHQPFWIQQQAGSLQHIIRAANQVSPAGALTLSLLLKADRTFQSLSGAPTCIVSEDVSPLARREA